MYTIILSDGTQLCDLELNGNNFISAKELQTSDFEGKLDKVTFIDAEGVETVAHNLRLSACRTIGDGRCWFILEQKTQEQLAREQMLSLLNGNAQSITDIELALVEIYELLLGR